MLLDESNFSRPYIYDTYSYIHKYCTYVVITPIAENLDRPTRWPITEARARAGGGWGGAPTLVRVLLLEAWSWWSLSVSN